jgi:HD-GYP domain-containing protein (c-di-GMP phosphodiesterase class II)
MQGQALNRIEGPLHRGNAEGLLAAMVEVLAGTVGLRDDQTGCHCGRVVEVACRIGRQLGLGARALRELAYAARVHDIGKVGVPDAVLRKPGPLTSSEWTLVQGHSQWGSDLLGRVPGLERVAAIVRHHHERFDGGGYPDGLSAEEIPLESRILAVADAYVAMTEDRPYRRGLPDSAAEAELYAHRGAQFDPLVVDALLASVETPSAVAL